MGDMTDLILSGSMEDFGEDMGDGEYAPMVPTPKRCAYCGMPSLHWGIHEGKWRLMEPGNRLHICKQHPSQRAREADMPKPHIVPKAYAFYCSPIKLSEQHQPIQAYSLNGNPIHPKVFVRLVRLPDHCVGDEAKALDWAMDNISVQDGEFLLNTMEME